MKIEWLGMSCFKIQTKNGADEITLVIEPYDQKECGKRLPRGLSADILLKSPDNDNTLQATSLTIDTEGEYEQNGVFIYAMSHHWSKDEKIIAKKLLYRIETEEMSIAHLGGLSTALDNGTLERFQGIDILLVPIGGGQTLDDKKAQEVISQIEPRLVIPMNYRIAQLNAATAKILDNKEKFSKAFGASDSQPKLKIAKKNLPEDKMEICFLDPA